MQAITDPFQIVKVFWTKKSYNPAPDTEVRSFFFTPQEEADYPETVNLLNHFLGLLVRDQFLSQSFEYSPDYPPIKMFQLTPMGVELGKQLAAQPQFTPPAKKPIA